MILRRTILLAGLAAVLTPASPGPSLAEEASIGGPAHTFVFQTIDGGSMPLAAYRGKLLLIVNTATQCGFAGQFADLQALWETYADRGLVVIGAPSNDFGGQEPGTATEIKDVCSGEYGVTFPMTEKVAVRGEDTHPFFAWATKTAGPGKGPMWNFHKFLVSPDGRLVGDYPTPLNPRDPRLVAAIEANLPAATH
jgi:glutathione peroxidase